MRNGSMLGPADKDVRTTVMLKHVKEKKTPTKREVKDKQEHMEVQRFKLYNISNECFTSWD